MIIQSVFFVILCVWTHNWLYGAIDSYEQELVQNKTREKITVSLGLFIGTLLIMLYVAPSHIFNGYGLLAIGFSLLSSFLIIRFLLLLFLKEPIFLKFFINPNLLLAIFFIIATNLLVLYWLKEVELYFLDNFFVFETGYFVLIAISGIYLGHPKEKKQWRLSLLAIVDPMIVVFLAVFLLHVILSVFNVLV